MNESLPEDAEPTSSLGLGRWADLPGTITASSAAIAITGLIVTLLLCAMLLDLYAFYCHGRDITWQQQLWFQAPTMGVAGFFWLHKRRQSPLGFSLRVAFALPFIHLLLFALGASVWTYATATDPYLAAHFSILNSGPAAAWVVGGAVALFMGLIVYGALTEGRRQPAVLYPVCIALLLFTLLLGLWLPITLTFAIPIDWPNWDFETAVFREDFLWICFLPPAATALAISLLASGAWAAKLATSYGIRLLGGSLLVIVILVAMEARATADVENLVAYANLAPFLFCVALLSLLAIAAVTATHWQALRALRGDQHPEPWSQEGTVVLDHDASAPGRIDYQNWFWGLRTRCDRFILRTPAGDLLVPSGARLVARIPLWTSRARPGDTAAVLRAGDRVRVTGFVAPPPGNAYRQSQLPIPGSRGLAVLKQEAEETEVGRDLALLLWRPAILYLAVISMIALPGLAGFFAL